MLRSEFIERTNYEPDAEEYELIEASYYDFDGNKDEFCKRWLKDKKSGVWEREAKLYKSICKLVDMSDKEREEHEKTKRELADMAGKYFDIKEELDALKRDSVAAIEFWQAASEANKEAKEKALVWKELYNDLMNRGLDVTIETAEESIAFGNVKLNFVNKSGNGFFKIEEVDGWVTCYKVDDIVRIEIT